MTAPKTEGRPTQDLLVALSLASLCFFKFWSVILTYTRHNAYFMKLPPEPAYYMATVLNSVTLGLILWLVLLIGSTLTSSLVRLLFRWGFLALILVPLNSIRAEFAERFPSLQFYELMGRFGRLPVLAVLGALALLIGLAVLFRSEQIVKGARFVLLILFPFTIALFGQAIWRAITYNPAHFENKASAPMLPGTPAHRVIWTIWDEWDYRLTFEDRKPDLQLPHLDRLTREALHSTHTYPPSGQTPWSLPAYTTGGLVADANGSGPDEMMLKLPDGSIKPWSKEPSLFDAARAVGVNSSITGWYNPYCRVIGDKVASCEWWEFNFQHNSMGHGLLQIMGRELRSLFETNTRSLFGQALAVKEHAKAVQAMRARSMEEIVNPSLGLVFIHLPIPHSPYPYNRLTGEFTLRNPPSGYYDNLALLDKTVGEMRAALEKAGLWDKSTFILTADHWNRFADVIGEKIDHRVPMIIKAENETQGVTYDTPSNTIMLHDLTLAIMKGEVSTPDQIRAWLDQHKTIADTPYGYTP